MGDMDLEGLVAGLSADERAVIPEMSNGEVVHSVAQTAADAGVSVAAARKAFASLREKGLAEYGPLTDLDDGTPMGSGTWLTGLGIRARSVLTREEERHG